MKIIAYSIKINGIEQSLADLNKLAIEIKKVKDSQSGGQPPKALDALAEAYRRVDNEAQMASTSIEKGARKTKDSELSYNSLGREISKAKAELEQLTVEGRGSSTAAQKLERTIADLSVTQREVRNRTREAVREAEAQGDAYKRLTLDLAKARREYKALAAAGNENTDEAVKLRTEINKLDSRVKEIDASVGQFQRNVGNYSSALDGLLGRMQSLTGVDLSKFSRGINGLDGAFKKLGGGRSILGLLGAAAIGATAELNSMVLKYDELRDRVNDVTGLEGVELNVVTADVLAISDVFDQEYSEVLNATNTLTKELTGDFNTSLRLIENGFIAGANASGQYLDNLREYSSQARETELSANQLLEVLIRSEQEGIFSDKGIDTVKEGGLRIREQTNATRDALENAFGEDFTNDLFDNLNKGAITSFEALQKVSKGLTDTELTAEQTQTVIADVFGGPGEDAGLRFIEILQDVDGEFTDLLESTDAYTRRQVDNLEATRKLTIAQANLSEQLSTVGFSFEALGKRIKADFFESLDATVSKGRTYVKFFKELFSGASLNEAGLNAIIGVSQEDLETTEKIEKQAKKTNTSITESALERNRRIIDSNRFLSLSERQLEEVRKELLESQKDLIPTSKEYLDVQRLIDKVNVRLGKSTSVNKAANEALAGSLQFLRNELSKTREMYTKATNDVDRFKAFNEIESIQSTIDEIEKLGDVISTSREIEFVIDKEGLADAEKSVRDLRELLESDLDPRIAESVQKELERVQATIDQYKALEVILNFRINTASEGEDSDDFIEKYIKQFEKSRDSAIVIEQNFLIEQLDNESLNAEKRKRLVEEFARFKVARELEAQQKILELQLQSDKLTDAERLKLKKELNDKILQLHRNRLKKQGEEEVEEDELSTLEIIDQRVHYAAQLASKIFDLQAASLESRVDNELSSLDREYDRKIEAAEGNQALQDRLHSELEAKKTEVEKQAAEERRKIAKKEALINAAQAASKTLANFGGGLITAPLLAIALATIAAQAAIQLAIIDKTKFEKGGRILSGKRHSEGGIPAIVRQSGEIIEVEDGEFVVPRNVVNDQSEYVFKGRPYDVLKEMTFGSGKSDAEAPPSLPRKFERGGRVDTFSEPPAAIVGIHEQKVVKQEMEIKATLDISEQIQKIEESIINLAESIVEGVRKGSEDGARIGSRQGTDQGLSEGIRNIERNRRADENSTF